MRIFFGASAKEGMLAVNHLKFEMVSKIVDKEMIVTLAWSVSLVQK